VADYAAARGPASVAINSDTFARTSTNSRRNRCAIVGTVDACVQKLSCTYNISLEVTHIDHITSHHTPRAYRRKRDACIATRARSEQHVRRVERVHVVGRERAALPTHIDR
jgi:hypothetical protein